MNEQQTQQIIEILRDIKKAILEQTKEIADMKNVFLKYDMELLLNEIEAGDIHNG